MRYQYCPNCGREIHGMNTISRIGSTIGCQGCEMDLAHKFLDAQQNASPSRVTRMAGGTACYIH